MRVGVWFYAVATMVTGVLNIVWMAFEPSHQPITSIAPHFAGQQVLACLSGVCLIAAGIAILSRRTAQLGALGSGVIYLAFALFWLPRFYTVAHAFGLHLGGVVFVIGGIAAQIMLAAPAVLVYTTSVSDKAWREQAVLANRWMLGVPPITFGLGHLISLSAYVRFVPHWVPFPSFCVVFSGLAFLLAGIAIVAGVRDILAARLLALMLLLFEFMVELPPVFAQPHSQTAWGGAVYNLTAIGACWIFAEFSLGQRAFSREGALRDGIRFPADSAKMSARAAS